MKLLTEIRIFLVAIIAEVFKGMKIPFIFLGVFVCLVVASPLSPFVLTYFLYDRWKNYQEIKNGFKSKKKDKSIISLVNEWANADGND